MDAIPYDCNLTRRAMTAETIAKALGGRKAGAWWSCRCPTHDDRNPSLGVRDGDRSVIVRCFAGCDSRDVIAALRARGLWDGRDDYRSRAGPRPRREPDRAGTTAAARALWRKARPAAGSIVARYLAARGIEAPVPPTLRFLAECWHGETRTAWPAMLAGVTRWPDREPARYAHVPDSALVAAADRVAARITAVLDGKDGADVVPLRTAQHG